MGHRKGSPEREVHNDTSLTKMTETFQIYNLTLHLQEQRHPRASRRKDTTKIRAELNDI